MLVTKANGAVTEQVRYLPEQPPCYTNPDLAVFSTL
jgi:hypothetical protein